MVCSTETADGAIRNELHELQQIYRMMSAAMDKRDIWVRGLFPRCLVPTVLSVACRHGFDVDAWGEERSQYRWVAVQMKSDVPTIASPAVRDGRFEVIA